MDYNAIINLARENFDNGEYEKAIYYYETAFEENPDTVFVLDLVDLGLAYLENGNYDKSLSIFEDVLEQSSSSYIGYHFLGVYYFKIDDKEKAIEWFLKSYENDDRTVECLFDLGLLYDELNYYDKAIEFYEKTLEIDENHFYGNLNMGAIHQERGEYELALKYAMLAHEANPDEHFACYNIGVALGLMKRYEEALEWYHKELQKDDFCVDTYYNMAIIYKDFYKDYNKSIEYYLTAISFNSQDYRYWYNLGCVYCLQNDFLKAYDAFMNSSYINHKVVNYISNDDETQDFIKSDFYKKIKDVYTK